MNHFDSTRLRIQELALRRAWMVDIPLSCDDIFRNATTGVDLTHFVWEPRFAERLVEEVSAQIARCLLWAEDFRSLTECAIRFDLEYERRRSTVAAASKISVEALNTRRTAVQRSLAHDLDAVQKFADAGTPIGKGFAERSRASVLRKQSILGLLELEIGAATTREAIERNVLLGLESRHSLPGGAVNFRNRIERLSKVMEDEFRDIYVKSLSISDGLKATFGIDFSPPQTDADDILARFYTWSQSVRHYLIKIQCDDESTVISIGLEGTAFSPNQSIAGTEYGGNRTFSVPESILGEGQSCRLTGFALSFKGGGDDDSSYFPTTAIVTPPVQNSPRWGEYQPRAVPLTVCCFYGRELTVPFNRALSALSPIGTWNIKIKRPSFDVAVGIATWRLPLVLSLEVRRIRFRV